MAEASTGWIPPLPPRQGLRISVTHPTESIADGVVRYRIVVTFDRETTRFDDTVTMPQDQFTRDQAARGFALVASGSMVTRRFSEFETVFSELSKRAGSTRDPPLPKLPRKRFFGNNTAAEFVEKRRMRIESYAQAVTAHADLFSTPAFLHLIGFSCMRLWFALFAITRWPAALPHTIEGEELLRHELQRVLAVDAHVLRSDALHRVMTARTDAIRGCVARLLALLPEEPEGLAAFTDESVRIAFTTIANAALDGVTITWISHAIRLFATASRDTRALVARGDIRDGLCVLAARADSEEARGAVARAVVALVRGPREDVSCHLLATHHGFNMLALLLARVSDHGVLVAIIQLAALVFLHERLPSRDHGCHSAPKVDRSTDGHVLFSAFGTVRDRARETGDRSLFLEAKRAMQRCGCPMDHLPLADRSKGPANNTNAPESVSALVDAPSTLPVELHAQRGKLPDAVRAGNEAMDEAVLCDSGSEADEPAAKHASQPMRAAALEEFLLSDDEAE